MNRRATPTGDGTSAGRIHAFNEFGAFQCLKVLADRGVGETELGGELGSGDAFGALQALDDATLGAGQVAADVLDDVEPKT